MNDPGDLVVEGSLTLPYLLCLYSKYVMACNPNQYPILIDLFDGETDTSLTVIDRHGAVAGNSANVNDPIRGSAAFPYLSRGGCNSFCFCSMSMAMTTSTTWFMECTTLIGTVYEQSENNIFLDLSAQTEDRYAL